MQNNSYHFTEEQLDQVFEKVIIEASQPELFPTVPPQVADARVIELEKKIIRLLLKENLTINDSCAALAYCKAQLESRDNSIVGVSGAKTVPLKKALPKKLIRSVKRSYSITRFFAIKSLKYLYSLRYSS